MKILAIHGSPRIGNSKILLDEAVRICNLKKHEIKVINPCELNISGCNACNGCSTTGVCVIRDDMDKIYPLLKDSQRIIIASPIFFFSIPAQLKLLIDRCQCLWYEKYVLKSFNSNESRKALVMLVGGMKKGEIGVTCAEATIKAFLRTINFKEHKTISYLGYDQAGDILKNLTALQEIRKATEELLKDD